MMKAWVRARRSEAGSEERRAVIARRETLVRELKNDKYDCRALHARSIINSGRALSIAIAHKGPSFELRFLRVIQLACCLERPQENEQRLLRCRVGESGGV